MCITLLTEGTLQLNPEDRPTVNDIIDRLKEIAEARHIKLDAPLNLGQPVGSHPSSPGCFSKDHIYIHITVFLFFFFSVCHSDQCHNPVVLPFYSSLSFKISKILSCFGFKVSFRLVNNVGHFLEAVNPNAFKLFI